jgi:hypothetical protein
MGAWLASQECSFSVGRVFDISAAARFIEMAVTFNERRAAFQTFRR